MKTKYIVFVIVIIFFLIAAGFGINQFITVEKAHSTFANYYAFRGCTQLVKRTDSYGICKLSSGQEIKLVKFQNKWYLDNDLPVCVLGKCW